MFKVMTRGFAQEYDRWTDALDQANALIPTCTGLLGEIRIFEKGELVWSYTRTHKYPLYLGPGTYNRLARRFVLENTIEYQPELEVAELEVAVEVAPESEIQLELEIQIDNQ